MKVSLLLLLLLSTTLKGQSTPAHLGSIAYKRGHYEEARTRYLEALAQTEESEAEASILVNVGHCDHHAGKPAEALLSYLRALKRLPREESVNAWVADARKILGTTPPLPPSRWEAWKQELGNLSPMALSAGALLLLLLACAHALRRRRTVTVPSLALFLGSLLFTTAIACQIWLPAPRLAVAFVEPVPLRSEPHLRARASLVLDKGSTFHVGAFSDRWVEVRLPTGTFWAERSLIGLVD
jgi:tetratricopeptide (TPR) repeat protein